MPGQVPQSETRTRTLYKTTQGDGSAGSFCSETTCIVIQAEDLELSFSKCPPCEAVTKPTIHESWWRRKDLYKLLILIGGVLAVLAVLWGFVAVAMRRPATESSEPPPSSSPFSPPPPPEAAAPAPIGIFGWALPPSSPEPVGVPHLYSPPTPPPSSTPLTPLMVDESQARSYETESAADSYPSTKTSTLARCMFRTSIISSHSSHIVCELCEWVLHGTYSNRCMFHELPCSNLIGLPNSSYKWKATRPFRVSVP